MDLNWMVHVDPSIPVCLLRIRFVYFFPLNNESAWLSIFFSRLRWNSFCVLHIFYKEKIQLKQHFYTPS